MQYPVETVAMMNEIISSAEEFASARPDLIAGSYGGNIFTKKNSNCNDTAIAKASVTAAAQRNASAIIVLSSQSPSLPRLVSAYRPDVPIITFTPSAKLAKQLIIHRGIHPVVGLLSGITFHKRPAVAIKYAKDMGFVESGDDVIVVGIEDDDDEEFATMKVASVP
jgi:pyruvate kinase